MAGACAHNRRLAGLICVPLGILWFAGPGGVPASFESCSLAGLVLNIRIEDGSLDDRSRIRAVIEAAFGRSEEADLVDMLRGGEHVLTSLVAEMDHQVVGHILFSRMWIDTSIDTASELVSAVALAPVAVSPRRQRSGIGSRLIRHGLELMRERGEGIVIVAGHPDYYARFGFSTEKTKFLHSPFPPEAFMAVELSAGALQGIRGSVVYPPAFGL